MDADKAKFISLLTSSKIRAIGFDIEITLDNLKNSGWTTALAGAGLGLSLTKWQMIEFTGSRAPLLFAIEHAVVSIPLLISVAMGAYLNWRINERCSLKRQKMTLFLKQEAMLFTHGHGNDAELELGNKIFAGKYLNEADQEKLSRLEKRHEKLGDMSGWIAAQQSLMVVGYLAAVGFAALYKLNHP